MSLKNVLMWDLNEHYLLLSLDASQWFYNSVPQGVQAWQFSGDGSQDIGKNNYLRTKLTKIIII